VPRLDDLEEESLAMLLDFCAGRVESEDSAEESGTGPKQRKKAQHQSAKTKTQQRRAVYGLKHQVELDMQGVVGRADDLVKQWRALAKQKPKEEPKPPPAKVTSAYAAPPKGKGKGLAWNPKGKGKGAPSRAQNEIAALASRAQQLLPSAGYGGPPMSTMAVYALAYTQGPYDASEYGHYAAPFPPVYQFHAQPGAA
jgi:hypothetical protein